MCHEEFLVIGRVLAPHGVHGKIRIRFEGDDPQHLLSLNHVRLGPHPQALSVHRILRIQPLQRGPFILTLEGFDYEKAKGAVGQCLWVRRDQLPPLESDEFYWVDLIGLRVLTEEGEDMGVVEHLLETGSNEVLVCYKGDKEVLIPFIREVVQEVDLKEGWIRIRLVEGLL
jgi:16S rRNA processing protein RimM